MSPEKIAQNDANGLLQTECLLKALGAVTSSGVCQWCGVRPAENNARNSCTECEDLLLGCC